MPRTTAFLAGQFATQIREAGDLAEAAEGSSSFLYTRRLYIYEAAYLIAFSAWENMLEQCFLRFLCGHANSSGQPARLGQWPRPNSVHDANILLLGSRPHLLWHSPQAIIGRSKQYFTMSPHESVLASALPDIQDFAAIRHFVAHRNKDTALKFQGAATRLTGAPIHGGRAGRLLRTATRDPVTGDPLNWLDRIGKDLERYALQIAA